MILHVIFDFLVLIPLAYAFYTLWRELKIFRSFIPFIIGIFFILISKFSELFLNHLSIQISDHIRISRETFDLVFSIISGFIDVFGVLFPVIGFIQTVEFKRALERKIRNLEALLPICASCKKYRSEDGIWHSIEKYLTECVET